MANFAVMKASHGKKVGRVRKDLGSPASVDRFRSLASSFTAEATASKKAAIEVLRREGIVTAKGNLTKHYAAK